MQEFDLIVLGTGGAGYAPAMRCRKAGWNVAVINDGPFSGTCAVRGCIPKKVLAGVAELLDTERRFHEIGVLSEVSVPNWKELMRFKHTFTDPMPVNTKKELQAAGITLFTGTPHFTGKLSLEINGQNITGKKIHIAVGAQPAPLNIEGAEHVIVSDDFLELTELPERIVFIGGGYISFEFAHIVARFGVAATILHSGARPLEKFDADIVDTLVEASSAVGIIVEVNTSVTEIKRQNNELIITAADGRVFSADLVVHGAGRIPAIGDLNLDVADIEYAERDGITVDEYLQTTNPNVTAAGDACNSGPPLSPVAGFQGELVADGLLGNRRAAPSYYSTPSVIFSTPSVGKVGYLEKEASEKGIDFEVKETDLSKWFDSKRIGLKYAKSKILIDKTNGKIIGAHLIGNHAEDLINIYSLAIELGLTANQLKTPIMAFPTTSDDLRDMF